MKSSDTYITNPDGYNRMISHKSQTPWDLYNIYLSAWAGLIPNLEMSHKDADLYLIAEQMIYKNAPSTVFDKIDLLIRAVAEGLAEGDFIHNGITFRKGI